MRWWFVMLVAACGDNFLVAETNSGSRLKLGWYEYPDGARQLARTYDGDRPCILVEWTDGKRRCMTELDEDFPRFAPAKVAYTDAACTTKIGRTNGVEDVVYEGEHIDIVYEGQRFELEFRPSRVFAVGDYVATPPAQVFERRDGACVEGRFVAPYTVELDHELSLDHLVTMTRSELPSAGRLAHVVERGGDGSNLWIGFHDRELATPCVLEYTEGGSLRCTPAESHAIEHFADAACREPAVVVAANIAPRFASSVPDVTTGCTSHHAVGTSTGRVFERAPGGGCNEVALVDQVAYRVGAPITSFATVEQLVDDDPARRLQDMRLAAGSLVAPPTGLFDTRFGERCISGEGWFGDDRDAVRCRLPVGYGTLSLHADASCATEQLVTLVPLSACAPPERYTHGEAGYHEILAPTAVYGDDDCRLLAPPAGYEYRALGPAFDATELALATLVVDP